MEGRARSWKEELEVGRKNVGVSKKPYLEIRKKSGASKKKGGTKRVAIVNGERAQRWVERRVTLMKTQDGTIAHPISHRYASRRPFALVKALLQRPEME